MDAAFGGCVKRHLFLPSGRSVHSVVGSSGEEFVDPDRPFCSCQSYYFSVLGGKAKYCYHLLGYRMAAEAGLIDEVRFDDEEYDAFLRTLLLDVIDARGPEAH